MFCTPLSMFQCISAFETVCFCDISRIYWWIFARHCPCFNASVRPRLYVSVISPVSVDGFLHATVHVSVHQCIRDCMFLWYLPYLLMDFCTPLSMFQCIRASETVCFCDISRICWWIFAKLLSSVYLVTKMNWLGFVSKGQGHTHYDGGGVQHSTLLLGEAF